MSRPTTSASIEAGVWTSPMMPMTSPEFPTFDAPVMTSDLDRLLHPVTYGESVGYFTNRDLEICLCSDISDIQISHTNAAAVDWTLSPPPQDSYFPDSGYFPQEHNISSVRGPLSVSPPLFSQLTPGLFQTSIHTATALEDMYHQTSTLHLAPVTGEGRPESALLRRRRSSKSPGRRPRRLSNSEEEAHAHGWDPDMKTCRLELPGGGMCNTRVKTYNNFLRHCRFQHGEKEPREECNLCGQSFGRPDALRNHKEKSKKHKKLERLRAACWWCCRRAWKLGFSRNNCSRIKQPILQRYEVNTKASSLCLGGFMQ